MNHCVKSKLLIWFFFRFCDLWRCLCVCVGVSKKQWRGEEILKNYPREKKSCLSTVSKSRALRLQTCFCPQLWGTLWITLSRFAFLYRYAKPKKKKKKKTTTCCCCSLGMWSIQAFFLKGVAVLSRKHRFGWPKSTIRNCFFFLCLIVCKNQNKSVP